MAVCLITPDANGHVYLDQAEIGAATFSGCLELKSLTMSKVITLKYKAFHSCSNLELYWCRILWKICMRESSMAVPH